MAKLMQVATFVVGSGNNRTLLASSTAYQIIKSAIARNNKHNKNKQPRRISFLRNRRK